MLLHVQVRVPNEPAVDEVSATLHTHGYTDGLKTRLELMGVELFEGVVEPRAPMEALARPVQLIHALGNIRVG